MYNVPSFTLARTIGGVIAWYWKARSGRDDTPLIVLASVSSLLIMHSARYFGDTRLDRCSSPSFAYLCTVLTVLYRDSYLERAS